MKRFASFIAFLLLTNLLNAQNETSMVLLKSISGEYSGKRQNGLADGKGTATGEDTYTGLFKDGLPDGKGTYVSKNGDTYKGYWKNGLKHGKGKLVYTLNGKSSTLTGYWKEGDYVGKSDPDITYRVTGSSGIMNYTVKKIEDNTNYKDNVIIITIKSAMTNFIPSDIKINNSTGRVMREAKKFVVSQYFCPLNCEVSYSIDMGLNQRKLCRFTIEILELGRYEIILSND